MSRSVRDPDYRADWSASGTRLVARILIRRRRRCQQDRTHTIGHCRNCGAESQAGKRRRQKRERRQAPARAAWDLYAALKAKGDQ